MKRNKVISSISLSVLSAAIALIAASYSSMADGPPRDFVHEAEWINRVFACGTGAVPAGVDAVEVEKNCASIGKNAAAFRMNFINPYTKFIEPLRPKNLPKTVLYPFGGGDLFTAIATFPRAEEIITVSLETSGDPERPAGIGAAELSAALRDYRQVLGTYYLAGDNSNTNVRALEKAIIPGQLTLSLAAAAFFGYRPVSVKFFRIEPDGSLYYFTAGEIAALKNIKAEKLHPGWQAPACSVAFSNMEAVYVSSSLSGHRFVHRHVSANLHNDSFLKSPLRKFLQRKGALSALTKAGSYLLWMDGFSGLRGLLLAQMVFMVSDSTGILPRHSKEAGFEQVTYGTFNGAFLENRGGRDARELRDFWKSRPYRPLPFRFGYSDILGANHLMITFKPGLLKK